MSIYINKDTKVITQGITGKTGSFHTAMCRDYGNGAKCFVAGVNPRSRSTQSIDGSASSPFIVQEPGAVRAM